MVGVFWRDHSLTIRQDDGTEIDFPADMTVKQVVSYLQAIADREVIALRDT